MHFSLFIDKDSIYDVYYRKELYIYCFSPVPYLPEKENSIMQEQPQQHPLIETRMETLVKGYRNSDGYRHEAAKLGKAGWTIKDTAQGNGNRRLSGKVIVPFGMFTKPNEILITYERVAGTGTSSPVKLSAVERKYVPLGMPQGLSYVEQVRWIKAHKS